MALGRSKNECNMNNCVGFFNWRLVGPDFNQNDIDIDFCPTLFSFFFCNQISPPEFFSHRGSPQHSEMGELSCNVLGNVTEWLMV